MADCETFKLPLAKVATSSAENLFGFKVHQLFVGVSSNESLSRPAATEKLLGVQSLVFAESSSPNVPDVVFELSEKLR